jgi:DNA invertase Pin-like site-specific DNA recombinase
MKVIYGRISTASQNLERQMQNEGKCFLDVCSGTIPFFERTQSNAMMHYIRENGIKDVYTIHVDRLGRNLIDILNTFETLSNEGINLHIEGLGFSTLDANGNKTPVSKMLLTILGMIAEMERETGKERQAQGIAVAKQKGNVFKGRKRGATMKDDNLKKRYASRLVIYQSMLNGGDSLLKIEKCTKGKDIAINRATLKALIVKGMLIKPERINTKQRDENLNLMK